MKGTCRSLKFQRIRQEGIEEPESKNKKTKNNNNNNNKKQKKTKKLDVKLQGHFISTEQI